MTSKGSTSQDRELLSLKVLLHCRTVVEKANFVSTGVMTQVDGELFEVELGEFDLFELGEKVKLTVYSPAGIQTFHSIVFAKYEGAVAVIQPPAVNQRFQEKREFYRVEAEGSARIMRVVRGGGEVKLLGTPLEARLCDISLGGICFATTELYSELDDAKRLGAVVDLGFAFACDLEMMRRERRDDQYIYGLKMKVLDLEMLRPLRAFLLRRQVEKHILSREESSRKRLPGV